MINSRVLRLSAWVALVLVLVAALPARPSFAQAGNSPLPAARLESFAYGVAAGDLTSDSVVLWTRTPGAASVSAELAASETFENLMALPAMPTTDFRSSSIPARAQACLTTAWIFWKNVNARV